MTRNAISNPKSSDGNEFDLRARISADRWLREQIDENLWGRFLDAASKRDWRGALALTNSVTRFGVFLSIAPYMTLAEKKVELAYGWTPCDGAFWSLRDDAVRHLREVGYIGDLPKPQATLTLYRGVYNSAHKRGLCWSLSRDIARHFVRPGGRGSNFGGFIFGVECPPNAILAGFGDRDEKEYVVDPELLPRVRLVEVVRRDPGVREPF